MKERLFGGAKQSVKIHEHRRRNGEKGILFANNLVNQNSQQKALKEENFDANMICGTKTLLNN